MWPPLAAMLDHVTQQKKPQFLPVQYPWRFPATLSSTKRVRLSGVSGGRDIPPPPPPPPPPSVIRLASELCSSLDRDGLRTSPPPEPEPSALLGAVTTPGPVAEGHEGGSSLSGLRGSKVKVYSLSGCSFRSIKLQTATTVFITKLKHWSTADQQKLINNF